MKTKLYLLTWMALVLTSMQFAFSQAPAFPAAPAAPAAPAVCGGYTLTQGAYKNAASNNGAGAQAFANYYAQNPGASQVSITIGCAGNSVTKTGVNDIAAFMQSNSGAGASTAVLPTPSNLGSQLVAVSLNVFFDQKDNLGGQILLTGAFAGKTVSQFLQIANDGIGGCDTNVNLGDVLSTADMINNNYDQNTASNPRNDGNLSCCDKVGPVFSTLSDKSVQCSSDVVFDTPTARDAQDGSMAVTAISPDQTTGTSCTYTITRTWTATDKCGNTTTASQTISVNDNTKPVAPAAPANLTVSCIGDVPATFDLIANDNCSGVITATGVDTNNGGSNCNLVITRTWTFTDVCGNSSSVAQTITVKDVVAPVAPAAPENLTVSCIGDVPTAGSLTANDNCSGAITVTGVDTNNGGSNCNLVITRTWTFTDACGNASSVAQTITVKDVIAPVAPAAPANLTVSCIGDVPAAGALTANDNCSGVITATGVDAKVGTSNCNLVITRTWTFTDACNNSSSATQTITVKDVTAPTITAPADVTATCSNIPGPGTPTATDNCGSATLSAAVKSVAAADCSGNVVITYTWTATDACGNTATASQHITYNEITCKFTTVTQGGWGAKPAGGNWGMYLVNNFARVFPTGFTIGNSSGAKSIKFTSPSGVQGFLPNGGTPKALSNTTQSVNPTSKSVANTLAGQTAALTLNVGFFSNSASLVVLKGAFAGQTVSQMLAIANAVLGGSTAYSASSVNDVLNNINQNFDDGNGTNLGFLGYCVSNQSGGRDIASETTTPAEEFANISAYPNPFVDRIKIEFAVEETSHVNLQLYNSNGLSVGTLFNDTAEKGVKYHAEFTSSLPGMYIYRMTTSKGVITGKVIQIK